MLLIDVSDHCPLIFKGIEGERGPKPFRFNNFWIENKKLKKVLEQSWEKNCVVGWMGVVLKSKLNMTPSVTVSITIL